MLLVTVKTQSRLLGKRVKRVLLFLTPLRDHEHVIQVIITKKQWKSR